MIDVIKKLTNKELCLLMTVEEHSNLPDTENLKPIKEYIDEGKKTFEMGKRINEIELLLLREIVNRFIDLNK